MSQTRRNCRNLPNVACNAPLSTGGSSGADSNEMRTPTKDMATCYRRERSDGGRGLRFPEKLTTFFASPLSSIIASHNVLSGRGEIVAHPAFELIGSVLPFGNERKYESPEVDPGFGTSC